MKRKKPAADKTAADKPAADKPAVKKRSRFTWLYILIWIFLVGAFGALAMTQASEYSDLQNRIAATQAEIERALYDHAQMQREIAFIGSDAYIEQQARERLGWVLPTELVFVNIAQ